MVDKNQEFINSFQKLEKLLKVQTEVSDETPFKSALSKAAERNVFILKNYGLFEEHSGHYCLLCEPLDLSLFLVPVKKNKTLQIGTIIHYGQGFTKAIEKQRKRSKKVEKIEF